jgi:hypothetical protein
MSLLTLGVDLPNLDAVLQAVQRAGKGNLPYTKQAIHAATTDLVQKTWIEYASGVQVHYSGGTFSIRSVTGEYLRSIQDGLRFPDDLTGEVFSTSPHRNFIEDGQPARDMKAALLSSPRAKIGKDGKKWMTIPFRHGAPGTQGMAAMPTNVYALAKQLGFSRRNGVLTGLITGNKYTWNGRLSASAQGQRSHSGSHPGKGYTWKSGQYSGMVKMGKGGHSQYITFRRVSENSDPKSWQFPGVKPKPIREAVIENTKEDVLALIRRGFEMDLYFMGLGGDGE